MNIHLVKTGEFRVNSSNVIIDRNIASIEDMLDARREFLVIPDAAIPNSASSPTIKAYLEAEAADGYDLAHMDQGIIVTALSSKSNSVQAVISNTTSGVIDVSDGSTAVGIITPSVLVSTSITFLASDDGTTFNPLYDEGTLYSVNVGTSRHVALKPIVMHSAKYLKIVTGSSEASGTEIRVVTKSVA